MEESHDQHRRSAPQLKGFPLDDAESRANLSELLARLISSRKGENFDLLINPPLAQTDKDALGGEEPATTAFATCFFLPPPPETSAFPAISSPRFG